MRELPHFLLGQSMGGAVALKVHLKQPKEWDGVLLVAPMCKVGNRTIDETRQIWCPIPFSCFRAKLHICLVM